MTFSQRSYKKELLDEDLIPFEDIKQNMRELDFINKWLGGHGITIDAFKYLSGNKRKISVCEIGCGGGDNLIAIYNWSKKNKIEADFTGVDIKEECIHFAKNRRELSKNITWIASDYSALHFTQKPDIIFSSLFCHHFTNQQLIYQLNWMKENSRIGFFINDLQRNAVAYYSIKLLTSFFSNSYLVKNDAPLSVARGFTRKELLALCDEAKVGTVEIKWEWAFRYVVIFKHER